MRYVHEALTIGLIGLILAIPLGFAIMIRSNADDAAFAYSSASDVCPGVPQLNWFNDSTLEQSTEYGMCVFPTERELKEGRVDWHKTRLNFERKCKIMQNEQNAVG